MGSPIVWKLNHADPLIASVRYRCLIPVFADLQLSSRSVVVSGDQRWKQGARASALIIVKSFRESDVVLAEQAVRLSVPVYFDICDNIYSEGYGGRHGRTIQRHFECIAHLSREIITPGPALQEILQSYLPGELSTRITVHPDPFETRETTARILRGAEGHGLLDNAITDGIAWRNSLRNLRTRVTHWFSRRPLPEHELDLHQEHPQVPQVLWFGNAGNRHSAQGLAALAGQLDALAAAYATSPFILHVVSNNAQLYRQLIADRGIPTSYETWTPLGIFDALDASTVCILPVIADAFTQAKSANRLVLALAHGVPVVASSTPAYRFFQDYVILDDFNLGLSRYLREPQLRQAALSAFHAHAIERFTPVSSARAWIRRIDNASE